MFCRQASGCFEKFENGDLHPQVSGVFRHQKPRFSESVSRVGFLKTEVFEYDDFIDHAVHGTCKRCHRISIVLVFTCGRAKAIRIRSMKTDISFRK